MSDFRTRRSLNFRFYYLIFLLAVILYLLLVRSTLKMAIKNSLLLALAILSGFSLGFPGGNWKASIAKIKARAAAPITSPDDSNELIGDLLSPGPTTPVGQVRDELF